ncbi:MAG: glycosyltransferase family 4 protein [Verrucomicrobia bacterium]|jgi:mannosylglucosylglycerate synthase|nr:glycosyltransferase family 4 protein [Verrucomicrobiota bacterium]
MAKAKPTVAILHYSCPPVIGGVEFIMEAHAREFIEAGFKVKLIVGKGGVVDPDAATVVIPEIVSGGGPLAKVLAALDRGEVPNGFDAAVKRVEKKLATALRGVDICMMHNVMTMHFNMVLTAALTKLMKRSRSTRFIGWTHDLTFVDPVYEPHQHRRYPWSLLLQPQAGCDYCAISGQRQMEMKRLFRIPANRIPVIPDGISVPKYLCLTKKATRLFYEERLSTVDVVAITPARILRRKNLGVGMEVVAALKKRGKSVRWMITGAPDAHNPESMKYYRMLVSLRRKLNVQKEVVFLSERFEDSISHEDLCALYRLSDLLLFPSDREGFGLPVLEAGLAGLVVVISDIPALREIAKRDAVYIHLGDSASAVAKNIIAAIKKRPELLFRKKVIQTYAWEVVFEDRILPAVLTPRKVWAALQERKSEKRK